MSRASSRRTSRFASDSISRPVIRSWRSTSVTLVMPGIVATEFGTNALGGGPDSRVLPGAQSVEDATRVIVDVIEKPRPEAYTQPAMQADVERYYRDVGAVEQQVVARFRR